MASDGCSIISVSPQSGWRPADKLCFLLTLPFWPGRDGTRERQTPSISTSSIVQSKMPFARLLPSCPKRRRLDFPRATFSHLLTRLFSPHPSTVFCAADSNSQTLYTHTHAARDNTLGIPFFWGGGIRIIGRKKFQATPFYFCVLFVHFPIIGIRFLLYMYAAVAMFFSFANDR